MSRCRHFDDEPVSADATPAPAIIAADIPAVTTTTPNHPKSRSTHAVFCPRSGRTVTRRISPGGRLRQLTLVLGSQDRLATGRVVARTRSRGGQTEGDASAIGVRQIGLCSGQVAMARPWRRRYRDDRWPSSDPLPTQGDVHAGIPAELVAAGFEDPEEIGRGGFGVVYRCSQRALDRTVAVKVLTADLEPDNLERFVREQVAMGKLSGHPHIVTIFQVGTTATGRPYIVMQYHPHGSLEAKIHDSGPIGWARRAAHRGEGRRRVGNRAPTRARCIATSNRRTSCSPSTASRS